MNIIKYARVQFSVLSYEIVTCSCSQIVINCSVYTVTKMAYALHTT